MDCYCLADTQWAKIEALCLGKVTVLGRTGGDGRMVLEAVLRIARTGRPWRDLPAVFGNWNSVFKRFRDWAKADVIKPRFDAFSDDPEMECAMVDANIVKAHRHGDRSKRGTKSQAMGKSKGGLTTKILAHGSPRQSGAL
jgi:transposase